MADRVDGEARVGDRVAYEDQANPRRVFRVNAVDERGQYRLAAVDGSSLAPEFSDLRQHGWTFDGGPGADGDGPACESGWTGDRCKRPLFHGGEHDNEAPEPTDDEVDAAVDTITNDDARTYVRAALDASFENGGDGVVVYTAALRQVERAWSLVDRIAAYVGGMSRNELDLMYGETLGAALAEAVEAAR